MSFITKFEMNAQFIRSCGETKKQIPFKETFSGNGSPVESAERLSFFYKTKNSESDSRHTRMKALEAQVLNQNEYF